MSKIAYLIAKEDWAALAELKAVDALIEALETLIENDQLWEADGSHIFSSLIYAADVCGEYEKVVSLYESMLRANLEPNRTTRELVVNVGKKGAKFYEETQLAANVASAAAGLVGVVGMALGRW